jgi:pilus assembly protein CpaB
VSPRSGLIMIWALAFGGSAAVGVNKYMTNKPGVVYRGVETVPVVVAAVDIPRGASITAGLVKTRDYPKGILPSGTLAKVDDVLDRAVFIPLMKDEPVLDGKLAPKGSKRGMAALVPSGMRAFTIHTPSVASGVAGFVLPGNKVDVLLTMEGKRGSITMTLLQNLEILAVDQRIDAPVDNRVDPNQLRSVTLLVTPDQAAKLGLAQNKGALHLSLRNHSDDQLASTSPARLAELEGYHEETPVKVIAEAPKPPPPQKTVTIYRGGRAAERRTLGETQAWPVESVSRVDYPRVDEFR